MKLLVVSHACVTPINQSFYADVAQLTGWDIALVIPAMWATEYKADMQVSRWKDFKGTIHAIPVWKAGNVPLHTYKNWLISLLRREKPDVIYVHHEPYGLATLQVYLANQLAGRCPIGFYSAQNISKNYPVPFRWFETFVLKTSSFCFPVTQGALNVLRAKGYNGRAEVLPLPVDPKIYRRDVSQASAWRTKLQIEADAFVVGYLGRLVEEKGLTTLLHSLKILKGACWRCVLAGSGAYESTLRTLVQTLGLQDHVLFPGVVPHDEAPWLLSMFNVFVLPSETRQHWKEQFGRVIIEANACGTAVIGTESGEIGNVLRSTGGGIIVPEANVLELGKAILDLSEHPDKAHELAERGMKAVYLNYDQAHLASRFADAIATARTREGSL